MNKILRRFKPINPDCIAKMPFGGYVCERCFDTFTDAKEAAYHHCAKRIRKPYLLRKWEYARFTKWISRNAKSKTDDTHN